jgi:hypothetical protein
MWAPWMSANFGIRRAHILEDNITLSQIISMWDSVKPHE